MTAPAPPAMSDERLAQIEWSLAYAEKRQGLMTTFDVRDLLVEVKRLRSAAPPGVVVARERLEQMQAALEAEQQWHADQWEGYLEEARQANAEGDEIAEREACRMSSLHGKRSEALWPLTGKNSILAALKKDPAP